MAYHVLTAEFMQENNTFVTGFTGLEDFAATCLAEGAEAIKIRGAANTELAGFLEVGAQAGWKIAHIVSACAEPGPPVARRAFDFVAGRICEAIERSQERIDGILLGLHGAMTSELHEDGEGELLQRIRALTGPALPIAITLDLHANVTPAMADHADIVVSYKTYPHTDIRERACQAGRLLNRAMAGLIKPRTLRFALPMMQEADGGRSDVPAMKALYDRCRELEAAESGILALSLNAGFDDADTYHTGATVLVTYDTTRPGALEAAKSAGKSFAAAIWDRRHDCKNVFLDTAAAASVAKRFDSARGPLIIADYADNPGSGAYGDATNLLRAMLDAGLDNAAFGPVIDPEAAAALCAGNIGDTVTLAVGGKKDPRHGGPPLTLTGVILCISNGHLIGSGPIIGGLSFTFGPSAVLRVAGIEILIVSKRGQALDLEQFRAFGIDPAAKATVGLKSMQHFRAAFGPIAGQIVVCDSGAISTPDPRRRHYKKIRRPVFPLDDAVIFSPG